MIFKQINLFLAAILVIVLYFAIPANNKWLYAKILDGGNSFATQLAHLDPAERKMSRYGYSYMVYMNAIKRITTPANAIVLLPPNDYIKNVLGVTKFVSPEPAVFYYYTGVNAVWANSPDVGRANWEIHVRNDTDIVLRKIINRKRFDSIVAFYKQYIK
jgi:hypothetical protein